MKQKLKSIAIFPVCLLNVCLVLAQNSSDQRIVVYFGNNMFVMDKSESKRLDSQLSCYHIREVTSVAGYTDSVGTQKSNLLLSQKRINWILNYLKKNYPVRDNITVQNFGMSNPESRTDYALNRRVEITLRVNAAGVDSNSVHATDNRAEKIILDKLYFIPDQPILESSSLAYLRNIATTLKNYQDGEFEIRGHVNCPLTVPANSDYMKKMKELSEDRARMVYEILKENGVPGDKMKYKGMGNSEMLYPNAGTDEEKRKNMRVEIFILRHN